MDRLILKVVSLELLSLSMSIIFQIRFSVKITLLYTFIAVISTVMSQTSIANPIYEEKKTSDIIIIRDTDLESNVYNWTSDNIYLIDGHVFLESGGILNIEAGTNIRFKEDPSGDETSSALIIARGAQIFAEGTAESPILFTAESDVAGANLDPLKNKALWAGIIILGNAPIMREGLGELVHIAFEEDERALFGGNNPNDNSGVLKYVSIRYTGKSLNGGSHEALRLGAIGRSTVIEHVEIFSAKHDGLEIWGGTVDVKNLAVSFAGDECYEINGGWRGIGQFWFALQGGPHDPTADWQGEYLNNGELYSAPNISNATFIGSGPIANDEVALVLRQGFAGKLANSIFEDYPTKFIVVEDIPNSSEDAYGRLIDPTNDGYQLELLNNTISRFNEYTSFDNIVQPSEVNGFIGETNAVINELTENNNIITQDPILLGISRDPEGLLNPKPSTTGSVFDIFSENMVITNYRGAFSPTSVNTWLHGWTSLDKLGYLVPVLIPQLTNDSFEVKVGEIVEIEGTNLGSNLEDIFVTVGNEEITQISLTDDKISFEIPSTLEPRQEPYDVFIRVGNINAQGSISLVIKSSEPILIDNTIETIPDSEINVEGENLGTDASAISVTLGGEQLTNIQLQNNILTLVIPENIDPREQAYDLIVFVNGVQAIGNVTVKVNPIPTLIINNITFDPFYSKSSTSDLKLSVDLSSSNISNFDFRFQGITENVEFNDAFQKTIDQIENQYEVNLSPEELREVLEDPLGMLFEFSFTSNEGLSVDTTGIIYWRYDNDEIDFETTNWRNVADEANPLLSDYNLIALPFERQSVSEVLNLGSYDTTQWRLYKYNNNSSASTESIFEEYNSFNQFEPLEGYALIMLNGEQIEFGGQIPEIDERNGEFFHELNLRDGWNLVGNPYPFSISWDNIKLANPDIEIGNINRMTLDGYEDNTNILNAYEGAFVFHMGADVTVKIPVHSSQMDNQKVLNRNKKTEWILPIQIEIRGVKNKRNGIGMKILSSDSWDIFDAVQLPQLYSIPEVIIEDERSGLSLNRSIVQPKEFYIWQAELTGGQAGEKVRLNWNVSEIPESVPGLFIWDALNSRLVDMKQNAQSHFLLPESGQLPLQIYYGTAEDVFSALDIRQINTGEPYPNPVKDIFTLPIVIPVKQRVNVNALVTLYNNQGQQIAEYSFNQLKPGYQELDVLLPEGLKSGLYHYQLRITGTESSAITGRIIRK